MLFSKFGLAAVLAFGITSAAVAGDSNLLKVSGLIDGPERTLSFDDFSKLKATSVTTATPWTPRTDFVGVALSDLLDALHVKSTATTITVTALDGYVATIPISDAKKWPIILAYQANGKRMTIETKGPLWVVYPLDSYSETKTSANYGRMAWATTKIKIQ